MVWFGIWNVNRLMSRQKHTNTVACETEEINKTGEKFPKCNKTDQNVAIFSFIIEEF